MLMKRKDSLLMIIDVQERLAPVTEKPREVITGCSKLVSVAKLLNIPFIITEQYPEGLGSTIVDIRNAAEEKASYLTKTEFSSADNKNILKAVKAHSKKQIIIAGVETHICVLQTALALKALGFDVFVVGNACSSRTAVQNAYGIQRLMGNQVDIVTTEMVFFEWLEKSGTEEFKEISKKYVK